MQPSFNENISFGRGGEGFDSWTYTQDMKLDMWNSSKQNFSIATIQNYKIVQKIFISLSSLSLLTVVEHVDALDVALAEAIFGDDLLQEFVALAHHRLQLIPIFRGVWAIQHDRIIIKGVRSWFCSGFSLKNWSSIPIRGKKMLKSGSQVENIYNNNFS